jgi:hypothetical protein
MISPLNRDLWFGLVKEDAIRNAFAVTTVNITLATGGYNPSIGRNQTPPELASIIFVKL